MDWQKQVIQPRSN